MTLSPSRRDTIGPPPRDVSDIAAQVRHHGSYLRSLDPGIQDGRFATPKPVPKGASRQFVGGDAAGDDTDYAWEYDDRHTVTTTGTQTPRLSHVPIDESLHVFWHPDGDAGLRLTSEFFTVDNQIVTIPDPGYWTAGDTFSFQYEYVVEDDAPEPFVVDSSGPGVYDVGGHTLTIDLPPGTVADDLLLLGIASYTGSYDDFTIADSRMSLVHLNSVAGAADAGVWIGRADGSGSPIIVHTVDKPSGARGVWAALATIRGANDFGTPVIGTASSIPTVAGIAAVEASWIHAGVPWSLPRPSGYTDIRTSGINVGVAELGFWYDPEADISPSATSVADGYAMIPLI